MAVSIPLLIVIPIIVIALLLVLFIYLRRLYSTRQISQTIKEKPLPNLFSNVYVSHKKFKDEVVVAGANNKGNLTKNASEMSLFREEALTAAPLIYSGPKSAPPIIQKSQTTIVH